MHMPRGLSRNAGRGRSLKQTRLDRVEYTLKTEIISIFPLKILLAGSVQRVTFQCCVFGLHSF